MRLSAKFLPVIAATGLAAISTAAYGQASGPDVIVGELPNFSTYTQSGGISAFAIGTTSCNAGDTPLQWYTQNNSPAGRSDLWNKHPVIGQNLFRYKVVNGAGQFEQIGQSFLKHGFTALQGSVCFSDCAATAGTTLGVHCSDPYSSSLNGSQSGLGPRSQVNAFTGVYPYPFTAEAVSGSTIKRRLQVRNPDLNPTLNTGAIYFAEGQYVANDDAISGNGGNNASYRRIRVTGAEPNYGLATQVNTATGLAYPTVREFPAIYGWKAVDPLVEIVAANVPGEGRLHIGYRVTDLGNGTWHYEYAVHNLNSDRSVGSFSINLPAGNTECIGVANIGFRDVDSHSGEPYALNDWNGAKVSNVVTWSADTYANNQNANAIRWGTMYTFRFDSSRPPVAGTATIGLFKPGTEPSISVALAVPGACPCGSPDFDGDGDTGTDADIQAYFACLGGNCCVTCGSADFDGDGDTGTDADIEAFFRIVGGGAC